MLKLVNGEVNIGDGVIWESGGKRFLGKFESLFDNKINVRLSSDNSLHTVPFKEVTKADKDTLAKYSKNRNKEELMVELKVLADSLKEHGVEVSYK